MHAIRIDREKQLAAEPHSGHNRYHPDIAPVLEVAEGEEVVLETRDSLDGQIHSDTSAADLAHVDPTLVHPLTGPVFVKGANRATCSRLNSSTSCRKQRHSASLCLEWAFSATS